MSTQAMTLGVVTRTRVGLIVAATAALAVAGCSSSGDNSGGSSAEGSATCVTQADKQVQEAFARSEKSPFPTDAVDGSAVKGKNFWLIQLTGQVPAIADFTTGFKAAADATGATVNVFDGKGSPATVAQGINSAIAANADGIALGVIDPQTVEEPLKQAAAAGIPVIDGLGSQPEDSVASGIAGKVTPSFTVKGTDQAAYALKTTSCKTNALIVATLSNPPARVGAETVAKKIEELCSDCKSTTLDIAPADIATKTVGLVQTALQRDPGINVIVNISDSYTPYVEQAESAVGVKTPIIGSNGDAIKTGMDGGTLTAESLYTPTVVMGWYIYDGIIRAVAGQTGFSTDIPIALVDKSNWGTDPDPIAVQPQYADYASTFEKLWGVSSS